MYLSYNMIINLKGHIIASNSDNNIPTSSENNLVETGQNEQHNKPFRF